MPQIIQRRKLTPVEMVLVCDCNTIMEYTGMCYATNPLQYEYECPCCGQKEIANKAYPCVEFIEE